MDDTISPGLPALVAAKRRAHRELRTRVTLAGLRKIAKREGIAIRDFPEPRAPRFAASIDMWGFAARVCGRHSIFLHRALRGEVRRRVLAHELAHVWLGHCAMPYLPPDDRIPFPLAEAAADELAAMLLRVSVPKFRAPMDAMATTHG